MAGPDRRSIKIDVTVDSDTRGSDKAAESLKGVDKSAGKAQDGLTGLKEESEKLDVQLAKTRTKVKELEKELVTTGDRTTGKGSLRSRLNSERSWLRELEKLSKSAVDVVLPQGNALEQSLAKGLGSISDGLPAQIKTGLITGLISAAALAAPTVGAMLAGAVAGTVGTAGVAGGVIMGFHDPRVKRAAEDVFADIKQEFFANASTFAEPVAQGLAIIDKTVQGMHLGDVFAPMADDIPIIATGIGDMANNAVPGLSAAFQRMGPFATAAADGMAGTGHAIGEFIDSATKSPGAVMGLRALFNLINNAIIVTGKGVEFLSNEYANAVRLGQKLVDLGNNPAIKALTFGTSEKWAKLLGGEFRELTDTSTGSAQGLEAFTHALLNLPDPTMAEAKSLKELNDEFERGIDLQAAYITDQLDVEEGLQNLADLFDKNGTDLSMFTEEGIKNQRALVALAKEMRDVRDDQIAMGQSTEAANAVLAANHERLLKQAEAAGISREAIEKLIAALFAVPDLQWNQTMTGLNPESGSRYGGKRAGGGPVTQGVAYTIGEHGPETFVAPGNGYIVPNGGMGGGMGWGDAGQTVRVVLDFLGADQEMVKMFRKIIKVESGGNVQLALGS